MNAATVRRVRRLARRRTLEVLALRRADAARPTTSRTTPRPARAQVWGKDGVMTEPNENASRDSAQDDDNPRVVVVGPEGVAVEDAPVEGTPAEGDSEEPRSLTDLVEQPAKVMRIGSMIKQLLDEVKSAPLDEASRRRLGEIHRASLDELEDGLAPELVDELERLALPFNDDSVPTDAELRVAQAQLVGWLEGLFHGIQTTLFAQQMAARAQLEQMRRALPPGAQLAPGQGMPGQPGQFGPDDDQSGSGMYL